jgi:hypothetical protein
MKLLPSFTFDSMGQPEKVEILAKNEKVKRSSKRVWQQIAQAHTCTSL